MAVLQAVGESRLRTRYHPNGFGRYRAIRGRHFELDANVVRLGRVGDVSLPQLGRVERNGFRDSVFRDAHRAPDGSRKAARRAIPADLQLMRLRIHFQA